MKTILKIALSAYFLCSVLVQPVGAQKYLTKSGHAYFLSHTDVIDIDGNNHQVAAIADTESGHLVVICLIKAFEFTLATADKHFNETYMESDEYPKAIFNGNIPQLKDLDLSTDGEYDVTAEGSLSIHGEKKSVSEVGKLVVKDGKIGIKCGFEVLIDDFNIEVPKSVEDRVAKEVEIKLDLMMAPK